MALADSTKVTIVKGESSQKVTNQAQTTQTLNFSQAVYDIGQTAEVEVNPYVDGMPYVVFSSSADNAGNEVQVPLKLVSGHYVAYVELTRNSTDQTVPRLHVDPLGTINVSYNGVTIQANTVDYDTHRDVTYDTYLGMKAAHVAKISEAVNSLQSKDFVNNNSKNELLAILKNVADLASTGSDYGTYIVLNNTSSNLGKFLQASGQKIVGPVLNGVLNMTTIETAPIDQAPSNSPSNTAFDPWFTVFVILSAVAIGLGILSWIWSHGKSHRNSKIMLQK